MSPLDPEQSTAAAVAAGQWSVKAVTESALGYIGTLLIGWLVSRVALSRRLAKLETSIETGLTEMEERLMQQVQSLSTEHAALAQEVWGAQQQNGLRGEVEKLKGLQQQHGETLASIKAMLELLLKRVP